MMYCNRQVHRDFLITLYVLFDGAVIVLDDIASNPVHIGTPGCCNIVPYSTIDPWTF